MNEYTIYMADVDTTPALQLPSQDVARNGEQASAPRREPNRGESLPGRLAATARVAKEKIERWNIKRKEGREKIDAQDKVSVRSELSFIERGFQPAGAAVMENATLDPITPFGETNGAPPVGESSLPDRASDQIHTGTGLPLDVVNNLQAGVRDLSGEPLQGPAQVGQLEDETNEQLIEKRYNNMPEDKKQAFDKNPAAKEAIKQLLRFSEDPVTVEQALQALKIQSEDDPDLDRELRELLELSGINLLAPVKEPAQEGGSGSNGEPPIPAPPSEDGEALPPSDVITAPAEEQEKADVVLAPVEQELIDAAQRRMNGTATEDDANTLRDELVKQSLLDKIKKWKKTGKTIRFSLMAAMVILTLYMGGTSTIASAMGGGKKR